MRVLYNKTSSQRDRSCTDEVVELVDLEACLQGSEGDMKFLAVPVIPPREESGIFHRGEIARNCRGELGCFAGVEL